MFRKLVVPMVLAAVPFVISLASAAQTQPARDVETTSEVPALSDLHEVIYPLWHNAWPNKDFKMMKDLLPDAEKKVEAVEKAQLPGILRDKKTQWDEGVARLKETLGAYKKAAADNNEKGLLDAVEKLHANFEGLVRIVYPKMDELDDFHAVLYQIYHKYMPQKDYDKLAGASVDLAKACEKLCAAQVPKRFGSKETQIKDGFKELCAASTQLKDAAKGKSPEATDKAVETVHSQYQKVEALFQ
jgi:hypothetical protein